MCSSTVWIEIQQMVQLYQSRTEVIIDTPIDDQSAVSLQTLWWKTAL